MAVSVAFDVTPLAGARTGIGQFVASTQAALQELAEPPTLMPYMLSLRARDLPPGTRRLPFPAEAAVRLWGRSQHVLRGQRTLRGADVVHGTNFVAPPTGLPTVLTVHDCFFVTAADQSRPVVRAFGAAVRKAIGAGAWVHAPSAHVADQVRELFATDRVRSIHHGPPPVETVDTGYPPLPGLDGRPYVLAVGTREARKNLPRLVLAFGAVHARHRDLALVLVGSPGDDQEAVDAAIDALPRAAAEQVLLTDWLPGLQRNHVLGRATVLAYPSLDEGFGFPMLEAMQLGVPVVASTAGALPEVAGDAALLVDPTDTQALAGALADLVDNRETRRRLIEAGRRRIIAFDWHRQAAELVELYEQAR